MLDDHITKCGAVWSDPMHSRSYHNHRSSPAAARRSAISRLLNYHTAHYRFFVTFRGADFRHSIETQQSKIESPNFRLGSRKVTMNHIIMSENAFRPLQRAKALVSSMIENKSFCPFHAQFCLQYGYVRSLESQRALVFGTRFLWCQSTLNHPSLMPSKFYRLLIVCNTYFSPGAKTCRRSG